MVEGLEETLTVGFGFTDTTVVAELIHPAEEVPVTVYRVVEEGFTVTVVPFRLPGCQVYVLAPLASSITEFPLHNVAELTVMVGFGNTITAMEAVFMHPFPSVTVTK